MIQSELPTRGEFTAQLMKLLGGASACALVMIAGYLWLALGVSAEVWKDFALISFVAFLPIFVASQLVGRRNQLPIQLYLEACEAGTADEAGRRAAHDALAILPRHVVIEAIGWWVFGGVLIAGVLHLRWPEFGPHAVAATVIAAASGGFVSALFLGFELKHRLRGLLGQLAMDGGEVSRERGFTLSLRSKLMVAVGGVTLVAIGFAICLVLRWEGEPLERWSVQVQSRSLAHGLSKHDASDVGLAALAAELRSQGVAQSLVVLDPETSEVGFGPRDILRDGEIEMLRGAAGDSMSIVSPNAFAWQTLADGRIAVAVTPWAEVRPGGGSAAWRLLILAIAATALTLGLAAVIARDIGSSTLSLRDAVLRVAGGDLRRSPLVHSEDEVGDLALAFEQMAGALRGAVGGVRESADRFESAAQAIAHASANSATDAAEQRRGVDSVAESMGLVRHQASGIDSETSDLHVLVEESSSAVLEISAASREVEATAHAFVDRVGETTASVEEMVRSVSEVGGNTAKLLGAADQTSAQMQTMAQEMRRADATAAETADLSRRVVERAEDGQRRVRETIESMESIRRSTEGARGVIRGLVERTAEIDAIRVVIDDVADETNLLALNAAIIAAQAGEQGRAFSVVADEIKELADRVLSSTKEIAIVVHAVQSESQSAMAAIEGSFESVTTGLERSRQAGGSLGEITSVSRESGGRMEGIAVAVRDQSNAAAGVVELMAQVQEGASAIDRAMSEQGRGNQRVLTAATEMRDLSDQLHATTAEQARGCAGVSKNIEGLNDAVASIVEALQRQVAACGEVVGSLDGMRDRTHSHANVAESLGEATSVMLEQANSLRDEVRRFEL